MGRKRDIGHSKKIRHRIRFEKRPQINRKIHCHRLLFRLSVQVYLNQRPQQKSSQVLSHADLFLTAQGLEFLQIQIAVKNSRLSKGQIFSFQLKGPLLLIPCIGSLSSLIIVKQIAVVAVSRLPLKRLLPVFFLLASCFFFSGPAVSPRIK